MKCGDPGAVHKAKVAFQAQPDKITKLLNSHCKFPNLYPD
jgi:hypothetical protein